MHFINKNKGLILGLVIDKYVFWSNYIHFPALRHIWKYIVIFRFGCICPTKKPTLHMMVSKLSSHAQEATKLLSSPYYRCGIYYIPYGQCTYAILVEEKNCQCSLKMGWYKNVFIRSRYILHVYNYLFRNYFREYEFIS